MYYVVHEPTYALIRAESLSEAKRLYRKQVGVRAVAAMYITKGYAKREYAIFGDSEAADSVFRKRKSAVLLVQSDIFDWSV